MKDLYIQKVRTPFFGIQEFPRGLTMQTPKGDYIINELCIMLSVHERAANSFDCCSNEFVAEQTIRTYHNKKVSIVCLSETPGGRGFKDNINILVVDRIPMLIGFWDYMGNDSKFISRILDWDQFKNTIEKINKVIFRQGGQPPWLPISSLN